MKLTFKPLFIVLFALLIPCGAWADVEIDGIYYNLIAKTKQAEVTNGGTVGRYSGSIVIPSTVQYEGVTYTVKTISSQTFANCYSLSAISIPNTVTSIGSSAFSDCRGLTSVTIPNSVTSINQGTFHNCRGLTSVTIPNSVISIDGYAFQNCSGLTSVTIPNSVTSIGEYALSGCSGLTSVTIPNSVTSIANRVFQGCSGLTSFTIPNSVITIGYGAFQKCTSLKSIEIPNNVKYLGSYAFYECSNLENVTIGSGIINIGNQYSVTIDGTYVYLSNEGKTFALCPNLMEVKCLAKNVPSTNANTFDQSMIEYCTLYVPLKSISSYEVTEPWSGFGTIKPLTDGILFKDEVVEELCLANWDTNEDGIIGMDEAASVTDLGAVFANNTDITSFDELQYFTGLTSIGEQAFYYCSNLTSVVIPENVTTIGNRAFYVCSGLKTLHIPASVTSIEDRAFAYCSGLETIEVDENNPYYDSRNNCNALIQTNTNTLLVGCKNSVIPDGVTIIAEGAFRGCTELTSLEIPEGVTTIGASAFRGCTGLTSVTLPSTITSIGNYAFSAFDEVYNLTTVTVGMTNPVAIASEVFPNRANSILYVPKGSRSAYKAANYWKEFKNIVELENGEPVKCETPTITIIASGKIKVESATEGATCFTNITASNAEALTDSEINLSTPLTVYTVTAYATADGFADSDVATATFRWEKTEGDMNGDGQVNISDVIQLVNIILQQ